MASMAKKAEVGGSSAYRKIDVDAFDENRYVDDDSGVNEDAAVAQRAKTVSQLVSKGDTVGAIAAALENPPVGSKEVSALSQGRAGVNAPKTAKDRNVATVISALTSVKNADIASVVKGLDQNQRHTLFQYIYAGMLDESAPHAVLLAWHERVRYFAPLFFFCSFLR